MRFKWKPTTLGELLAEVIDRRGVTPLKLDSDFTNEGHRVISAKLVKHGRIDLTADEPRFVDDQTYARWMKGPLLADDVIMTSEAPLGEVAYVAEEHDWCLGQRVFGLRTKKERMQGRFLYYALRYGDVRQDLLSRATGTTAQGIRQTELLKVLVPEPLLDQQIAIAHVLGTLDDKIELNRQMNETMEAIVQAIFKSWFVDFEPVRAKANDESPESICRRLGLTFDLLALFPDRLVDSELGLIPERWEVRKIESLLSRLSSKVRYTRHEVKPHGAVPVFEQGADILLGYHNGTAQFDASPTDPAFIFGDHTCVTHLSCEPFDISQNVIPLKGRDRPTLWVFYAVRDKQNFQEYRRHWMELITKAIVVAPEQISKAFTELATPLHLTMEANVRQANQLADLRDTILPKLLSGELPVPLEGAA